MLEALPGDGMTECSSGDIWTLVVPTQLQRPKADRVTQQTAATWLRRSPPVAPQNPGRPAAGTSNAKRRPATAPVPRRWPPGWNIAPACGPCEWCIPTPATHPRKSAAGPATRSLGAASCGSCARWRPAPPVARAPGLRAAQHVAEPIPRGLGNRWMDTAAPCI